MLVVSLDKNIIHTEIFYSATFIFTQPLQPYFALRIGIPTHLTHGCKDSINVGDIILFTLVQFCGSALVSMRIRIWIHRVFFISRSTVQQSKLQEKLAFSPQKRTSSTLKHEISSLFSIFVGHFSPSQIRICNLHSYCRSGSSRPKSMRIRIHNTALVDALWILQVAKILRSCKYTAMCTGQRAVKLQLVGGCPVAEFIDSFAVVRSVLQESYEYAWPRTDSASLMSYLVGHNF